MIEQVIDPSETTVFKLSRPIQYGTKQIEELELRPIIGKDLIGIKYDINPGLNTLTIDAQTAFALTQKLTGIPAGVLAQMGAQDTTMLSVELQSFLLAGRWNGQTTQP